MVSTKELEMKAIKIIPSSFVSTHILLFFLAAASAERNQGLVWRSCQVWKTSCLSQWTGGPDVPLPKLLRPVAPNSQLLCRGSTSNVLGRSF